MKTVPVSEILGRIRVCHESGCHEWTGYVRKSGYGQVTHAGKVHKAHRFFYEHHYGPISNGLYVCHRCHNRRCVNPEHLYVGTQSDNMNDMVVAGRQASGEKIAKTKRGDRNGSAKLSYEQVKQMRRKRAGGSTYQHIADSFGVTIATAWRAINRESWREGP